MCNLWLVLSGEREGGILSVRTYSFRKARTLARICTSCGKSNPRPYPAAFCFPCVAKASEYKHRQYNKNKALGLCKCGKIPDLGKKCCPHCLLRAKKDSELHKVRRSKQRKYERQQLRAAVIEGYGGKCNCCGCDWDEFLTIDHVNNDGKAHRDELGPNATLIIYREAIKTNFPPRYQLLCWNCNMGKSFAGGMCPHKIEEANAMYEASL